MIHVKDARLRFCEASIERKGLLREGAGLSGKLTGWGMPTMKFMTETIVLAVGAFIALLGAAFAKDRLFEAHMWVLFFVLLASTLFMVRRISFAPAVAATSSSDDDGYFV